MRVLAVLLVTAVYSGALTAAPREIDIEVSPDGDIKTLEQAQAAVRDLLRQPAAPGGTAISVVIHPGFYALEKPLLLTDADRPGPHFTVTWRRHGKIAPTISGGRKLGPWQVDGKLWKIEIPDAKDGKWTFRDLYVNGERRTRARTPNDGYFRVEKAGEDRRTNFVFRAGDVKPIANPAEAELVFLHDWSISRIPLQQIDEATRTLRTAFPIGNSAPHYAIDNFEPHPRYYLENAPEYLDAPGEWHLDTKAGVLSYLPLPDERPDSAEAIAPRLETLIEANFTPAAGDQPDDSSLRFVGLTFAHTAWPLPEGGYAGSQASFHEDRRKEKQGTPRIAAPAAITIDGARRVDFQQCTFTHLGGSGLYYRRQCTDCRARMCEFVDIGANGIMIGETFTREAIASDGAKRSAVSSRIGVENCRIARCGQTDYGAVGVWVGIAAQTNIVGNEILELPYTGISVGWRWDTTPTGCEGNIIAKNHIHHVLQTMSDGGGIYTLGRQPGTRLEANHIHDVPVNLGRAESNGLFLDEGSSEFVVSKNVIYGIEKSPIRFHRAERVTVVDNWLVHRPGVPAFRYNNAREETMTIRENQIVAADSWTPPAETPASRAGIPQDIAGQVGSEDQ